MCVLGLGLIGGSIMRAAEAAGREVFGYNRSVEGARGAAWPWFLAWLAASALLWWLERRRSAPG